MTDERASVFPLFMVAVGFVTFTFVYLGIHAIWPTIQTAAEGATSNGHALEIIGYVDLLIFPILPLFFLVMAFFYFNVRANRDAGGGV